MTKETEEYLKHLVALWHQARKAGDRDTEPFERRIAGALKVAEAERLLNPVRVAPVKIGEGAARALLEQPREPQR